MFSRSPGFLDVVSRMWFPAALVLLLILALPGFLLLALNLFGWESAVNTWLQTNWRLSYHIPSWWAALVLLLIPFLVALLYFLKLKRKPLQVPSTFLWKKSIEDLHVNALFQWLRNNLLLLLQLLTLLLLIYSLMAWQLHGATTDGVHYIIVVDNSASMSTTDATPSRLEQAREAALREIDGHSDRDFGMVIVFNSDAEILQSYTSDRGRLREAVNSIKPTQRPTRIDEALSLAASLANPLRSTENEQVRPPAEEPGKERTYAAAEGIPAEVHLFSDGRFPDVPEFTKGNLDLRMHLIGEPGPEKVDNVGIVTLNAVRDDRDPTKIQVLVNVNNYSAKEVAVKVLLEVRINGQLQATFEKQVLPQGEDANGERVALSARSQVAAKENEQPVDTPGAGFAGFELIDVDDRANVVLHAKLVGHRDKFPLDDEGWLVLGVVRKAKVAIVSTPTNKILKAFFDHEATRKVCEAKFLDQGDLKSEEKYLGPARQGAFDLVIFDRCAPSAENEMPVGNTFFIDAMPPPWKKDGLPKLTQPQVKGWLAKDPMLRSLAALYDIGIAEAFHFDLKADGIPPRTPRLLETDNDIALLFSLSRQSFTDVVMTFAIITDDGTWMTNWPLQPSFPLFLRNVVYSLGGVSDQASEENVQPGQVKTIKPDEPVPEIEVVQPAVDGHPDPEGAPKVLSRGQRASFSYGDNERAGVYLVKWNGDLKRAFAVNLLDADESNVEPRPVEEIRIGATPLTKETTRLQARETWKWVALAAVVLLLLEWFIYNRRIFV